MALLFDLIVGAHEIMADNFWKGRCFQFWLVLQTLEPSHLNILYKKFVE